MSEPVPSPLGATGPESLIGRYRHWYAHERDANEKMLRMLESVPESVRTDTRFVRAVELAAHLAACRENHLEILQGREFHSSWWPRDVSLNSLRARYENLEAAWTAYLDSLTDHGLTRDVVLSEDGYRYLWNIEGQVFQLVGHAYYHRGQISLLVDELGGNMVDTDYVDWAIMNSFGYGEIGDEPVK